MKNKAITFWQNDTIHFQTKKNRRKFFTPPIFSQSTLFSIYITYSFTYFSKLIFTNYYLSQIQLYNCRKLYLYFSANYNNDYSHLIQFKNKSLCLCTFSNFHLFKYLLNVTTRKKGCVTHKTVIFTDFYILPTFNNISRNGYLSLEIDNAGGGSNISEMFSIDYFTQFHNASDFIFEKQVDYWIQYKMVDFICTINNRRVGVSVARAMGYPTSSHFTPEMAANLLYKKLYGLIVARNAVIENQSFFKSILHIWCQDLHIATLLNHAYQNLDNNDYGLDVKGIILLQLTVCPDVQLYKNKIIHFN